MQIFPQPLEWRLFEFLEAGCVYQVIERMDSVAEDIDEHPVPPIVQCLLDHVVVKLVGQISSSHNSRKQGSAVLR